MDLRDLIEHDLADGPTPPASTSTADVLVAGRRALRRRRLATISLSTAAVLVGAGLVGTTLVGLDRSGESTSVAGDPATPSWTPMPTPTPSFVPPWPYPGEGVEPGTGEASGKPDLISLAQYEHAVALPMATYDADGALVIADGVSVLQRLDDPFIAPAGGRAVALDVRYQDKRYWLVEVQDAAGQVRQAALFAGTRTGFESWAASQANLAGAVTPDVDTDVWGQVVDLDLVRFDGDSSQLTPSGTTQLLHQRDGIDLGPGFAGPDDVTAAAQVVGSDEQVYYVLARRSAGGSAEYIAVTRAEGGANLQAFLDEAARRYAEAAR